QFLDQPQDVFVRLEPVVVILFQFPVPVLVTETRRQAANALPDLKKRNVMPGFAQVVGSGQPRRASAHNRNAHQATTSPSTLLCCSVATTSDASWKECHDRPCCAR